jgi:hypothetical protein
VRARERGPECIAKGSDYARPSVQRALAVQALIFWLSVGFSGRLIGFL